MKTSKDSWLAASTYVPPNVRFAAAAKLVRSILLTLFVLPLSLGSLDGTSVSLPNIFNRRPTIVVLAFSRKVSDESRTWCKRLFANKQPSPADDVYGVVLLSQVPSFLRGFVMRSIRDDVSTNVRSHFLTVTENGEAWRQLAHVADPDEVYLVVIGNDGTVQWRTYGNYSDQKLAAVHDALYRAQERISADAVQPDSPFHASSLGTSVAPRPR